MWIGVWIGGLDRGSDRGFDRGSDRGLDTIPHSLRGGGALQKLPKSILGSFSRKNRGLDRGSDRGSDGGSDRGLDTISGVLDALKVGNRIQTPIRTPIG